MSTLTTGQVARAAEVNIQTLRFYERQGILPAPRRSRSGYRQYGEEAVRIVSFVKRAQQLGFTLKEAKALLKLRGAGIKQRLQARAAAEAKIADIEARMRDLGAIKAALDALVATCACDTAGSLACPILEALEQIPRKSGRARDPVRRQPVAEPVARYRQNRHAALDPVPKYKE